MKMSFAAVIFACLPLAAFAEDLKGPEAFEGIQNKEERSAALFREAGKVIQSPRCVNCHPSGDRPLQGDDGHLHQPLVVRGDGGLGAPGMRCYTCHGQQNYDPARIPGHPEWHLAPIEMAWQGKSLGEICAQIKDKSRNGGRDIQGIVAHMSSDSLVGWGWHPGAGRTPAPGTQKELGGLLKAWAASGAACPAS
jgi:hypothetical protein